jgi:multicomponent Na+:H+ antiporter subunit E
MRPLGRLWCTLRLAAAFARDLVVSSLQVARAVLSAGEATTPRFVVVPLKHARSAPEITVVANYITLTPGTLTVDVSPDRSKLLVHSLLSDETGDAVRADIRDGIEVRVTRVSRP